MGDGELLFLVLSLIYLSDCLVWIGRRTVLFASPWCSYWRTLFANPYAGNASGGLWLLNPLPPLGRAFFGHWYPLSMSPTGVCDLRLPVVGSLGRPCQSGHTLLYEQIRTVGHDGKYLLLNGRKFTKCESHDQSELLVETIKRVIPESIEKRGKIIQDFVNAQFLKIEASVRLEQVQRLVSKIRWTASAFFVFLYVMVPILVNTYGLMRFVIPVAAIMFLAASIIALQYSQAFKTLFPLRNSDRISGIVKMVLCPPTAIRAGDLLTLEAMSRFHPVLIGTLLLGGEVTGFLRTVIRDLQYPLRQDHTDVQCLSIVSWFAAMERQAISDFLRNELSTSYESLLTSPVWDGISTAYCPRCSCQFTVSAGECPDCPGVSLLRM